MKRKAPGWVGEPVRYTKGSQHGAARRNFDRGHTPAVEHDEPITVFGAQNSGILCQCREHMLHEFALVFDVGIVVRDVHAFAADEADA